MKTSFYFVLWIGLYILIGIFGSQWMQYNSFFVALVAVWAISGLLNSVTTNQRAYMENREGAAFYELVYQNDFRRYLGIFRRHFWFDAATFIYFVITVVFLIMIRESWLIIAIFAFFGYGSAVTMNKSYKVLSEVRQAGHIELDEESMEQFNRYKEGREAGYAANQMYPEASWKDKLLRGCNFGFAILSIILGIVYICFYVPGLLMHGSNLMGSAMLVAYGGLAFIYGINDLTTSIKGYNTNIN